MIWSPEGVLAKWGVLDFAGGIVVHTTAGFAALASVFFVGRRSVMVNKPHNVPLIALGTGLLWFGWYGFNAGSELRVDAVTASAFLNTDVAASFAGVTWLVIEWSYAKRPKFVGLLTGTVAGLATITPGAGYVSLGSAAIIGIVASIACYYAVLLKNRMGWDDALDVWGVHGVGGFLGVILLGVFASTAWNSARRGRPVARRRRIFRQAMHRRGPVRRLGVRLHLRHAVADRPRHPSPHRRQGAGNRPRRGIARRGGLSAGAVTGRRRLSRRPSRTARSAPPAKHHASEAATPEEPALPAIRSRSQAGWRAGSTETGFAPVAARSSRSRRVVCLADQPLQAFVEGLLVDAFYRGVNGLSIAAAKRFAVSIAGAARRVKRFEATGQTSPALTGGDRRSGRVEAHRGYLLGLTPTGYRVAGGTGAPDRQLQPKFLIIRAVAFFRSPRDHIQK